MTRAPPRQRWPGHHIYRKKPNAWPSFFRTETSGEELLRVQSKFGDDRRRGAQLKR